jgi:hypothetical protein
MSKTVQRKPPKNNATGYPGVQKRGSKYTVHIRNEYLGTYHTFDEALQARQAAERYVFKEADVTFESFLTAEKATFVRAINAMAPAGTGSVKNKMIRTAAEDFMIAFDQLRDRWMMLQRAEKIEESRQQQLFAA